VCSRRCSNALFFQEGLLIIEAGTVTNAIFGIFFRVIWDRGEQETFHIGQKSRSVAVLDSGPAGAGVHFKKVSLRKRNLPDKSSEKFSKSNFAGDKNQMIRSV